MGGHITMAIIERYPEAYQGAMPMCGPLGAAIDFLNTGVFDMLLTFEALFPGTIGSPLRAQRGHGQQGEGGNRGGSRAGDGVRTALRAHDQTAARSASPLPHGCRRAEAARRRRAL